MVFVSMSDEGRPTPVRQWLPTTAGEWSLAGDAENRIEIRRAIEAEMSTVSYSDATDATIANTRFLAAPTDVNWGGKAHGGRVMEWIDDTAYLCATQWCQSEAVTVYVGGIRFYRPIHIGHVIDISARLIHTGQQTMHVSVHVYAGSPRGGELHLAAHSLTVLAALDQDGSARDVAAWNPTRSEDVQLDLHAKRLVALRKSRPMEYATCPVGP